jgi:hypothetical protein
MELVIVVFIMKIIHKSHHKICFMQQTIILEETIRYFIKKMSIKFLIINYYNYLYRFTSYKN